MGKIDSMKTWPKLFVEKLNRLNKANNDPGCFFSFLLDVPGSPNNY